MRRVRERPEAAVGDRRVRAAPVLEGDRVVALAPHDQRRQQLEQVEPVGRAHALAAHVDHRPQRVQERLARVVVLQRAQRPRDRLQVGAARHPRSRMRRPASESRRQQPRVDRQRQQPRDPRQRGGAQQRADLAPEPAARDQDEPLDALRELVEELHRDAAAERVPDDRRALDPDRGEQVADAGGVRAERVVASWRGRVAVADQVGCDDRVVGREPLVPPPASGSRS